MTKENPTYIGNCGTCRFGRNIYHRTDTPLFRYPIPGIVRCSNGKSDHHGHLLSSDHTNCGEGLEGKAE